MMTNLFSSFDPSSSWLLPLNWLAALSIMTLAPLFWKVPSKKSSFVALVVHTLHKEFNTLLGATYNNGVTILFISLFTFIIINNFLGLFPYIFTASSHMTMTLGLALPLWMAFMVFGWTTNTTHMLAHLVPSGTPGALMPFMVLIESVSNIIRPITLSVRLMANMVAGHLLMALLGNQTAMASNFILISLIATQILLLTLESAVAMIQAYVFTVLSTLYSSEVTTH